MNLTTVFLLFGGLGLFLYGMKLMSEGLEKAAGAKMRGILELFTKNRFIGMVVGILFTGIVQSSSATTVMVVSFVNSGLMNLQQASGVILGANIGTTVTGQLIAFDRSVTTGIIKCGIPLYTLNSTTLGSIIRSFTSSGEALYRILIISVLMQTDLPEPVAPAIRR